MNTNTNPVLTPVEAGEILRVERQTVMKLIHQGKLPATKIGRQWRIRREAVDALLDATTNHSVRRRDLFAEYETFADAAGPYPQELVEAMPRGLTANQRRRYLETGGKLPGDK